MPASRSTVALAAGMAVAAAFLWAAYYPLVLRGAEGVAPIALLAWPFVVGGTGFSLAAVAQGHGAPLRKLWTDRASWGRVGLLVAMQGLVLASTYLAGGIDTSLLSLLGDVVFTPLLLVVLFSEGLGRIRTPRFAAGIAVCTAGSILTIAAGGAVRPLSGWGIAVAVLVPPTIAVFFLATARATVRTPTTAVAGHAVLAAGCVTLVAGLLLPGGASSLFHLALPAIGALLAIGVTSFWIGQWLYFVAIQRAGLVLPAVLMCGIPVFTLLLSW
ncbi:MAG TPA: DMT family transporter, partial [Thermoplasmata archaeon]|nr:DMT family transporter [Thermoplasmata archaeon]